MIISCLNRIIFGISKKTKISIDKEMDMNVLQLSGKVKKGILHRFKTLKIIKYEETQPTIRLYLASNSSHRSLALNLAPFVTHNL